MSRAALFCTAPSCLPPSLHSPSLPPSQPTGIKGIIFDKDNTLTAPYIDSVHPQVAAAFENSKRVFGAKKLIIISNSAGTLDDANYEAATRIEATLGPSSRNLQPLLFKSTQAWGGWKDPGSFHLANHSPPHSHTPPSLPP